METQVAPQINTIKPSGLLLYLYSTLITLVIKGNNLQNTFQVVHVNVWVGESEEWRESFYSYIKLQQKKFFLFHIT